MYINLILAVFWLVLGVGLLLTQHEALGTSSGWLALLLAAYNVLRFLLAYARRTPVPPTPQPSRTSSAPRPYDPTFDFLERRDTN